VKKVLTFLRYLPIILLGIAGSVVVVDMWRIAGVGRSKVAIANDEHDGDPTVTPTPVRSAAAVRTPQP
jgi:hypothetical protein